MKLRLKLKTGEEFEAEGNYEFISNQKDAFLGMLSQKVENKPSTRDLNQIYKAPPVEEPKSLHNEPSTIVDKNILQPAYTRQKENKFVTSPAPLQPQIQADLETNIPMANMEIWDKIA
ncbi:MAG: hypothetical protein EZS28_046811, partial [Streblomastix strix]